MAEKNANSDGATKNIGLRGIPVADTRISYVDGINGKLIYRGYQITDLAENSSFEEIIHLLLFHDLPRGGQLGRLKKELAEYRVLPEPVADAMRALPEYTPPMDMLQHIVPLLGIHDPDLEDESKEANRRKAMRLVARFPLVVMGWQRLRDGLDLADPVPDESHAYNVLYALHDKEPMPEAVHDMDVALILHAEQTFNASSFTARQVASTQARIYACITAALGALSGGLHGGANTRVKKMLEEIGSIDNVQKYVAETLDGGGKIMGMGHAIYKTLDPRARILKDMATRLSDKLGDRSWLELSDEVARVTQEEFQKRKGVQIYPNVDFYSPTLYTLMGIPSDLFTPLFAVARVLGWAAHVIEERFAEAQPKPALYRPEADYVGTYCGPEGCEWVPLDKR